MTSSGRIGRRIRLVSALALVAGAPLAALAGAAPAYASANTCSFFTDQVPYGNATPLVLIITSTNGTPLGQVQFSSGLTSLGTATVATDQQGQQAGILNYAFSAPGVYPIAASYSGNVGTCSASGQVSVIPASTKTTVSSSPNPTAAGQQVTVTATVAVTSGGTVSLTGTTVTFFDGTTSLGPPVAVNGSGVATFTTSTLALGAHQIKAVYNGNANIAPSSAVLTQNVDTDLSKYLTSDGTYNLQDINLSGAYLAGADLAGANIANANLSGANLSGADLTGANLTDANFKNANLTHANLTDANLTRTNFKGVVGMGSAALTGATWSSTTCPDNTNSNNDGGTCASNLTP